MKRLIVLGLIAGCAGSATTTPPAPVATGACAASDTTAGRRIANVFIDGKPVATGIPARLEREEPESFTLEGPEPPALAALEAGRIDMIQFSRGVDAERAYRLCPGGVAFLVTTKGR